MDLIVYPLFVSNLLLGDSRVLERLAGLIIVRVLGLSVCVGVSKL